MESQPERGNLLDLNLEALGSLVEDLGEPGYRARQIFHAVYRRGLRSFASMTDLPLALRGKLEERLEIGLPSVHRLTTSEDGSRKYLLELVDGQQVESVYLVDDDRLTFCLSSQVGCAFGCDFCLTAQMGLVRQMTAGEIVGQVLLLADDRDHGQPGYNLVFMGMGEPLHNFDPVAAALDTFMSPDGLGLSYRRITLSTVGHVEGLQRLAALPRRPRLAISLNATEDAALKIAPRPVRHRLLNDNAEWDSSRGVVLTRVVGVCTLTLAIPSNNREWDFHISRHVPSDTLDKV